MKNQSLPNTTLIRQILDEIKSAVLMVDQDGHIAYSNSAAETLFKTSVKHKLEKLLNTTFLCDHEDDKQTLLQNYIDQAWKTRQTYVYRDVTLKHPEVTTQAIDCWVSPFFEANHINYVLIEMNEIDRIRNISRDEHFLNQYHASREIARGLAHEINNPLSGLKGATQLLKKEITDEHLHEYLSVITNEVERLQDLVQNILGPGSLPQKSRLDLLDILQHIQFLLENDNSKNVIIKQDYDPSIPLIYADKNQLIQALLNIAQNAWQAVDEKGTVIFRTRTTSNLTIDGKLHKLVAKIQIIDNGPGIPVALQDKIFYPMVSNKASGTGLGLSIAQTIVSLHQGLIELSSKPSETIFTIYLPIILSEYL